jgi:hypothetical protein
MTSKVVPIAAIAIAVLVIGIYASLALTSQTESSTSTGSLSSSTYSSTVSSTTCTTMSSSYNLSTTSSVTTSGNVSSSSSSSSLSTGITNGSFSYLPSSPIRILSVGAVTDTSPGGIRSVTFSVLFENVGVTPIYVVAGCGDALNSTVQPNSVLQKVSSGPLCECAEFLLPLSQGQNHTSDAPTCRSGFYFRLVQSGSVTVNLTLYWSTNSQSFTGTNSTSITARFTFT